MIEKSFVKIKTYREMHCDDVVVNAIDGTKLVKVEMSSAGILTQKDINLFWFDDKKAMVCEKKLSVLSLEKPHSKRRSIICMSTDIESISSSVIDETEHDQVDALTRYCGNASGWLKALMTPEYIEEAEQMSRDRAMSDCDEFAAEHPELVQSWLVTNPEVKDAIKDIVQEIEAKTGPHNDDVEKKKRFFPF